MPDADPTPEQQLPPAQQVDWEARYKGASTVINRLTSEKETLSGELIAAKAETESLRAQLGLKDTEKATTVAERDTKIQELLQAKSTLEAENATLKALSLKVKVANDLNHPELLAIADTIPNVTDEEALKALMTSITDWSGQLVKQREEQLLSGITPPAGPIQETPAAPGSTEAWQDMVNGLPLGAERDAAMNDWWAWEAANK